MHPIIEDILKHASYRKACYELAKSDGEDLYQEMLLALLSKSEEKLNSVYESGGHRWYVMQIIYQLYLGNRGLWDRVYRQRIEIVDVDFSKVNIDFEVMDYVSEIERNNLEIYARESFNTLEEYEQDLIAYYLRHPNILKISRESNVPYKTMRQILAKIFAKMKIDIQKKLNK